MRSVIAVASGVCLAAFVALAAVWRDGAHARVQQPIAFDHARHAQESLECSDCHARAQSTPYAGFPSIKQCLLCHKEAQGEHPDEPKIRAFAEAGGEIPWVQVNRMPGHVYFSHAMHVKLGGMQCADCHGDMSKVTQPVVASQIEHLTMSRCMDCHARTHASNDCLACHK